ncbi:MAG TPA: contact-dependent growth inhibition system immunity protein [Pseudonocardiaceae bacterium]|jgi:hypothetical protein|nr:contact-dependent growth inhibition system immunity protein [Pseudonocardiaceae bacterium]
MATESDQHSLTLEQIEQDAWGSAPENASRLVRTAHELRRKPIGTLTVEDLRLLISQQIGLDVLVPRAVALLRQNPLLEGDFYPGDLLMAVLKQPSSYWQRHTGLLAAMREVAGSVEEPDADLSADIERFLASAPSS